MSRYLPSLILLLFLAAASTLAWDNYARKLESIKADHQDALNAAQQASGMEAQRRAAKTEGGKRSGAYDKFIAAWSLHVQESNVGPGLIASNLSTLARKYQLLSNRGPAGPRDYNFGGNTGQAAFITFSVTGAYPQVMQWLGSVEETYLYGRIESASISTPPGSTASDVDMTIEIALLQENAAAN